MKRALIPSLLCGWCLAAGPFLLADGQSWLNNSATFKIDSHWSLKLTNEARHNEVAFMDAYLKNWQGGLVYNLPKSFYVAALYKRETSQKPAYVLSENRFTLESGWGTKLSGDWSLDFRFRTEFRQYEDDLADDCFRFRLRARLRAKLKIGALILKPFIASEPFADTLEDRINRHRFYLGTLFPMGEHAELMVNYIRQDTKGKEVVHILNSGINLKF